MKKLLIPAAAALAVAAAVPASAQYGNQANVGGSMGITNRITQLDARLQAGISNGAIDRMEARALRQQIRDLARLERQYSRNGLTQQERRDLQQRIRYTRQQLRAADDDQRYANWTDDSYYANDDLYGGYDADRGGYDADRGGDYRGSGYRGYGYQGSRYRQVGQYCAANRGGISAILGAVLGADNCLRVGERVTTNLSAVPLEYRGEFPSRSGYRYGYLEGNVVELDSNTGVVTGIFDVR